MIIPPEHNQLKLHVIQEFAQRVYGGIWWAPAHGEVSQARELVETHGNSFPSPGRCQIKMDNSVEDSHIREIHETHAEKQGRIKREIP